MDQVFRRSKAILPTIARWCLVSTFIEDVLHTWFRWSVVRDTLETRWACGDVLANLLAAINMLSQLIASGLVLTRYHVSIGCYVLFGVVVYQTVAYGIGWELRIWVNTISRCGALLLLLAECQTEAPTLLAGVPSDGHNRHKAYLLLTGRILTVLYFVAYLYADLQNIYYLMQDIIVVVLVAAVTIGYKTKLSALLLVMWLMAINCYYNHFWTIDSNILTYYRMMKSFSRVMSAIGGLLMIVVLGPGDLSVDNNKKNW
ncbi:unnamed protein product [Oppiella nova]|uniref:Surfeit locus protein 4 n=1 Tax=Oppiella nova TaxID=334625 RepID=A0A7R9QEM1_9ACAR|nr:unnamed protein product [Oppiella nova]CAG2164377.1 unnamed protein product [Oppiella nova]